MLPYRERMQREADRLRSAISYLETENARHKAVDPDFCAVRREVGRWIMVRRGRDLTRYHTLSQELRAVEAKLATAGVQAADIEVAPTDDELRARLPPAQLAPMLIDSAASLDHLAAEAARKRQPSRATELQQKRDELLAEAATLAGRGAAPAAAAGWPQPNHCGVYTHDVCEVVAACASRGTCIPLAEVLVVEVAAGVWLEATSYHFHHGDLDGHGFLPSVRAVEDGDTHPTREAAVRAGASRLLAAAQATLRRSSYAAQLREAHHLESFARDLLSHVGEQLEFAL